MVGRPVRGRSCDRGAARHIPAVAFTRTEYATLNQLRACWSRTRWASPVKWQKRSSSPTAVRSSNRERPRRSLVHRVMRGRSHFSRTCCRKPSQRAAGAVPRAAVACCRNVRDRSIETSSVATHGIIRAVLAEATGAALADAPAVVRWPLHKSPVTLGASASYAAAAWYWGPAKRSGIPPSWQRDARRADWTIWPRASASQSARPRTLQIRGSSPVDGDGSGTPG